MPKLLCAGAIGWAVMAAGVARADALVVRSTGPSAKLYPPGRSVKDSATVTLTANDQLTLLDGQGTRTLKGPGSFNLATAGANPAASSRFAALFNARSTQRARIGAVRSLNAAPRHSPNIWYVDASRSGPMCVADVAGVTLWRGDSSASGALTVKGPGGAATVPFAKGETAAAWPASLPVAAGGQYQLSWAGKPATSIRFALIGGSAGGLEDTAAALIRNGCSAQLDLLVDVMSLPDTSGSPQG